MVKAVPGSCDQVVNDEVIPAISFSASVTWNLHLETARGYSFLAFFAALREALWKPVLAIVFPLTGVHHWNH